MIRMILIYFFLVVIFCGCDDTVRYADSRFITIKITEDGFSGLLKSVEIYSSNEFYIDLYVNVSGGFFSANSESIYSSTKLISNIPVIYNNSDITRVLVKDGSNNVFEIIPIR